VSFDDVHHLSIFQRLRTHSCSILILDSLLDTRRESLKWSPRGSTMRPSNAGLVVAGSTGGAATPSKYDACDDYVVRVGPAAAVPFYT
jgi:hypothetical protein